MYLYAQYLGEKDSRPATYYLWQPISVGVQWHVGVTQKVLEHEMEFKSSQYLELISQNMLSQKETISVPGR